MATKPLPDFDEYQDFPTFRAADDDETRAVAIAHIDDAGVEAFLAAHSEYYPCEENSGPLASFLAVHGGLPFTKRNLEIAYYDLRDELKSAPPPVAPEVDKWASVQRIENLTAVYVPSDAEAAALAKLRDDTSLNDHQRKARDRKLALLAGQQRRELAPQNLYR